jgi:hypothetical protein
VSLRAVLVARGAEAHGQALAHDLARAGCALALTYWSGHAGALALRDELIGGRAKVVLARVDIAGDGAGHVAATRALEALGSLDALVLLPPAPAAPDGASGRSDWEDSLAEAVIGPALFVRAVRALVPALRRVIVVAPPVSGDPIAAAAAGALRGWAEASGLTLLEDVSGVRATLGL